MIIVLVMLSVIKLKSFHRVFGQKAPPDLVYRKGWTIPHETGAGTDLLNQPAREFKEIGVGVEDKDAFKTLKPVSMNYLGKFGCANLNRYLFNNIII